MDTISNMDDVIDSRDVIDRLEQLQAEYDGFENDSEIKNWPDLGEYTALSSLAEQGEQSAPDWNYGEQLIRESYFEQAMDEMVADYYELPKDLPSWMNITYDYEALKQDYTEVDYGGVTYLIR